MLAPIALFTYNRLDHTRRTVEALARNELASESSLFVVSDGPKSSEDAIKVEAVRRYVRSITGFKSIELVCHPRNLGLAHSIIGGVTSLCGRHRRLIVVEDDLETSPFFLRYMNEALDLYNDTPEVISVHGYMYPVSEPLPETFFIRGADCWGWATWQRGWNFFEPDGARLLTELQSRKLMAEFDFDDSAGYTTMLRQQIAGANNSWAIRWYASAFLAGKLTLYPGRSLVRNIGMDASGTHCGHSTEFDVEFGSRSLTLNKLAPIEYGPARIAIRDFYHKQRRHNGMSPTRKVRRLFRLGH